MISLNLILYNWSFLVVHLVGCQNSVMGWSSQKTRDCMVIDTWNCAQWQPIHPIYANIFLTNPSKLLVSHAPISLLFGKSKTKGCLVQRYTYTFYHTYTSVFINNQAIGLFGLIEVYKKPWIKDVFGDNQVNILYQGLGYSKESNDHNQCADLQYNPDLQSYDYNQYKIKVSGKDDDGYQSLQSFTKTIVDDTWMKHANVESFIRR